MAYKVI